MADFNGILADFVPSLIGKHDKVQRDHSGVLLAVGEAATSSTAGISFVATATDSVTIRVTFSAPVIDNVALRNVSNWIITPSLTVQSVSPEAVTDPTYIDLTVEEMKDSESYTLEAHNTLTAA